jgi:hypothetical protein
LGNYLLANSEEILKIEPVERKANGLVNILKDRGFVVRMADTGENLLLMMMMESSADIFIENGGFTAEFQRKQQNEQRASATQINIHSTGHGNSESRTEEKYGC